MLSLFLLPGRSAAQESVDDLQDQVQSMLPGKTTFLMRGYAHAGYQVVDEQSSFVSGTFAPIFLWRQSDRILFEAEAEIAYTSEGVNFALEYANLSYIISDRFVARFGNFLTPFGIFGERLHPNWINRFSTNPLGFDHHDPVGPFSEFGVELRGGLPLGDARMNYAVYLSNGPVLQVDTGTDPIAISTSYRNISDNNDNKALGGRLGVLPFGNSSLELGLSGQYARLGDRGTGYENIASRMYAVDLTFVKNSLPSIRGGIDLKAQWNYVDEDRFLLTDDTGQQLDVNNDMNAWFAMFSYRPSQSGSTFLSNLEVVARYSVLDVINEGSFVSGGDHDDGHAHGMGGPAPFPASPSLGQVASVPGDEHDTGAELDSSQWAFGLNYWLTWRSVLKMSYQITDNAEEIPAFYLHYALGF